MDPKFKIAYWLTDKKKSKLKIDQVEQLLLADGYQLIRILKPDDFETKGPFSVFFHKLTDITINQNNNAASSSTSKSVDLETENWIQKYKDYMNKYPWTRILDPLSKIENLLNRNRQYQLVVLRNKEKDVQSYFIPNFIELKTRDRKENMRLLRENNVKYPIVCKPLIAHGCTLAHQMSLVFSDAGLDDIRTPCVAQSFIRHSCKLYKLFVLKNQYFIVERPSLKNFEAGDYPTVHFDSNQISKMDSACELNEMSKETELRLRNRELNKEILDKIVDCMREVFGLTFYGVDVIIDDETDRYVIIDINNFPAYDGITDFASRFKDVLIQESKVAMYLYKNSLTEANNCNHNLPTSHQVTANTFYSKIRQWFLTLNK